MDVHPTKNGINRYWPIPTLCQTLAAPRQAPLWFGKSFGIAQAPAECSRAPGRSEFLAILQLKVQQLKSKNMTEDSLNQFLNYYIICIYIYDIILYIIYIWYYIICIYIYCMMLLQSLQDYWTVDLATLNRASELKILLPRTAFLATCTNTHWLRTVQCNTLTRLEDILWQILARCEDFDILCSNWYNLI